MSDSYDLDGSWAPCPGCDLPVFLDHNNQFMPHLAWFSHPEDPDDVRSVVECDWSRQACLDV